MALSGVCGLSWFWCREQIDNASMNKIATTQKLSFEISGEKIKPVATGVMCLNIGLNQRC